MKKLLFTLLTTVTLILTAYSTGDACSATVDGNIALIDCDDVGTSAFNTNALTLLTSSVTSGTNAPESYGASGGNGTCLATPNAYSEWHHYTLDTGVDAIYMSWDGVNGSVCNGFSQLYATFYQGTSCSDLTFVGCQLMLERSGPSYIVSNIYMNNLDPSLDLYVYFAGSATKCFTNMGFNVYGMSEPVNSECGSADSNASSGCNVGAGPTTWGGTTTVVGPESAWAGGTSTTCAGTSNWTSNENTVYYEVVATANTASVEISGVICNDGEAGEAQFAVFTDCNCFMNSGYVGDACFLGCAIGANTITLSVTPGETYIIAVDGFAGDLCKWDYTYVGVEPLSSKNIYLSTNSRNNRDVEIKFSSIDNEIAKSYEIYRSSSEGSFELIDEISKDSYSVFYYTDFNAAKHGNSVFYKIVQKNMDGSKIVSQIKAVHFKGIKVIKSDIYDIMGREISPDQAKLEKGLLIYVNKLENGEVEIRKVYQE